MGVFPKTEFSQNGGEGSNGGVVVVVAVSVGAVGDDRSFVRSAILIPPLMAVHLYIRNIVPERNSPPNLLCAGTL